MLNIFNNLKMKFANPYKRADYFKDLGVIMGDNCQVFSNVSFGSEPYLISLGNYVKITDGCRFITHDGGIEVLRNLSLPKESDYFGEIKIGNNVFIGNACIILPNVKIGDNVVIGAGSIVTRDVPANVVAYGNPCQVIRSVNEREFED